MAELVLFHHAQGLTPGVLSFAGRLRAAGHRVTVPDLFDRATFDTVDAGVAHAQQVGLDVIAQRAVDAVADLPERAVYAGFSLGAMAAQRLAQTRPGALAALLYHGAVPAATFGASWPAGVDLQVHVNDRDDWGEPEVCRSLVAEARDAGARAELFTYDGTSHLFTDESLAVYQPASAALVLDRTLALLRRWPG